MLKGNLTCAAVGKIITHYIEETLSDKNMKMVSIHLRNCPICMEKYTLIKKLYDEVEHRRAKIREKKLVLEEISAYLDGEMTKSQMLNFEAKLLLKPEYEDMMIEVVNLRKVLSNSFYKVKHNIKLDSNLAPSVIKRAKESATLTGKIKNLISIFENKS